MADTQAHKPPLEREALRDVIDLALWAGQMLLQHGAEFGPYRRNCSPFGNRTRRQDWMDILVSPNAIAATTVSGAEFRTKIRRVVAIGVNMRIIAEINHLTRRVSDGELDRVQSAPKWCVSTASPSTV